MEEEGTEAWEASKVTESTGRPFISLTGSLLPDRNHSRQQDSEYWSTLPSQATQWPLTWPALGLPECLAEHKSGPSLWNFGGTSTNTTAAAGSCPG